jgi:hypothetical protein
MGLAGGWECVGGGLVVTLSIRPGIGLVWSGVATGSCRRLFLLQSLIEWSDTTKQTKSLRRKGSTMERLVTSLGEAL